ncbi:MAG TPA: hypothetical protein VG871_02025 [Vicinamibacterales bacterium]|nr:hypothetical protein [Vicinamibacterales bacterium]
MPDAAVKAATTSLAWTWIVFELVVPPIIAVAVAWPFWARRHAIFGNIVGTVVIFTTGFGLIFREYIELDRIVSACLDAGTPCFPNPSAFTRFAIYASIAMLEVMILFTVSIRVEDRISRRGYAPEWR